MGVLNYNDIRSRLHEICRTKIDNYQIQPASLDLRLGKDVLFLNGEKLDIRARPYELKPNEFLLGSTYEYITIPKDLIGRVEGRSSIGRLGIMIHITAGYIDPAFNGNITLEIYNVSDKPFKLKYKDRICQLVLEELTNPVVEGYGSPLFGSHYQNSNGTVYSKWK